MKHISSKKALLIFYGFDIILVLILMILFLPLSRKNIPETSRMKFICNADEISSVEIFNARDKKKIIISKNDNVWIGTDDDSNMELNWPCDIQTIENFLSEAEKENFLYKKAEKVSSWASLGVDEKNSCRVSFFKNGSEKVSEFFFGIEDPVTERISFRTSKEQTVWETKTSVSNFLFKDASFWADPYIEPLCIADEGKTTARLRRGQLVYLSPTENIKPQKVISRIFSSTRKAVYSIYKKDDAYIVIPSFSSLEKDENAIKSINYRYSISQWTYEKFLEANDE